MLNNYHKTNPCAILAIMNVQFSGVLIILPLYVLKTIRFNRNILPLWMAPPNLYCAWQLHNLTLQSRSEISMISIQFYLFLYLFSSDPEMNIFHSEIYCAVTCVRTWLWYGERSQEKPYDTNAVRNVDEQCTHKRREIIFASTSTRIYDK